MGSKKILHHRLNFVEEVRKSINLDKPGRMDDAVDILEEWVRKQPHFIKKDFSREYLERTLISSKGFVERAKLKLDKYCTFKTLMPEFFAWSPTTKAELTRLATIVPTVILPETTENHYRTFITKVISEDYDSKDVFVYYKYCVMICEYLRKEDYMAGWQIIADFSEASIVNFISHVNPIMLRQAANILLEGYGLRLKGVYIITQSKMVGALVALCKQVLSAKLVARIRVVPDLDALYEIIPREVFPADYGGNEPTLKDLSDFWIKALTGADFIDYFQMMSKAATDESYRRTDKFNQDYVGVPGSIRALRVD